MPEDPKGWIEKIKKELDNYTLGDTDLSVVFEPLLEKCAKLAKNFDEFKTCLNESISTLRNTLNKVK
jgi:hypothetical protein